MLFRAALMIVKQSATVPGSTPPFAAHGFVSRPSTTGKSVRIGA
jgi:hypothetical protein